MATRRRRRRVSHNIRVSWAIAVIAVSVIGPTPSVDGEGSAKGEASTKGKASMKGMAEATMADCRSTRETAAMPKSRCAGRHARRAEYQGRSDCNCLPPHPRYSTAPPTRTTPTGGSFTQNGRSCKILVNAPTVIRVGRLQVPAYATAAEAIQLPNWRDEDWKQLFGFTSIRRVMAGDALIRHGEPNRTLYFVLHSQLEVTIYSGDGLSMGRVALVGAGSVLGGAGELWN